MERFIKSYKDIDLKLINAIKSDGDIIKIIEERGKIIESISLLECSKEELRERYLKEGLDKLDKEIEICLIEEKMKVKEEIIRIKVAKNAQNGYASASRRASLFSTKV